MFKKINKMYSALFGNDTNEVCALSYNETRPVVETVRSLEYTVKEQSKLIESLMDYMSVHTEWVSSHIGEGKIVIKKNK